nr:heavy metal translocating P-type ATPase [Desulfobulbaceae bacterium]
MAGGAILVGLRNHKNKNSTPDEKSVLDRIGDYCQTFVQRHIDPLFNNQERQNQIQTYQHSVSESEQEINRQLCLTVPSTGLAIAGAIFYPPLSFLSALSLLYLTAPFMRDSFLKMRKEKKLKYRLFAILPIVTGLYAGFYVTTNLVTLVMFLAFKISARSEARIQEVLQNTFEIRPPTSVWIKMGQLETEIPFTELRPGDIIIVIAGQTIPVDGYIDEGFAILDQHILTGESQPVEKCAGDPVFANTLILTGRLYIRVEKSGHQTASARIATIIKNATHFRIEHEARSEQMADKLTLPVLAASGLALATVGASGAVAIMNSGFGSLTFISGPLSMLSHLNMASEHGILVKEGRALEALSHIDTVIFDKTGTLTLESPEINQIYCCDNWTKEQVLFYAGVAEQRQPHPIAKAILAFARDLNLILPMPDSTDYCIGFGIHARLHDEIIDVGSLHYLQQANIEIPDSILNIQKHSHSEGFSTIMVAVNMKLIGVIDLQSQLRQEVTFLIEQLHNRKLKLCILSGDNAEPTQYLAKRLGVDDYYFQILPTEKADIIKKLQQQGRKVCYIGDGINDAIALRQADVSISFRGATDLATDSAQIILMGESLIHLSDAFTIADSFNKNMDSTLRLSFLPGSILIGGVFLFHFGMPSALFFYSLGLGIAVSKALSPPTPKLIEQSTKSPDGVVA